MRMPNASIAAAPPGRPSGASQQGELESAALWVQTTGGKPWLSDIYERCCGISKIDYTRERILDVGAGPISVFEAAAPPAADVVAYDTLAAEYNRLVPHKRFPITDTVAPGATFTLITLFNCLDHMEQPAELLEWCRHRLAPRGRIVIDCSVDQPFEPELHPQDFKFWQLVQLTSRAFLIERCGLVREGPLFPYAWWGVAHPRQEGTRDTLQQGWHIGSCGAAYARFHGLRALVKLAKMLGFRRFLRREWQF